MNLYQIEYITYDRHMTYNEHRGKAGILADSKSQAEQFIKKNVTDFKKIVSNTKSYIECNAITDEICQRVIDKHISTDNRTIPGYNDSNDDLDDIDL